MTFNLSLSAADLLLLLARDLSHDLVVRHLGVGFLRETNHASTTGHLSIAGLGITAFMLFVFDQNGTTGALFKNMYVLDHMAILFKIIIVGATALVLFISIDYVREFRSLRVNIISWSSCRQSA